MKVNFHRIVLKDIEGNEVNGDFAKDLGQQMYMQGNTMEEVELGAKIYHSPTDEPIELTVEEAASVSTWVNRWPYLSRSAIKKALNADTSK